MPTPSLVALILVTTWQDPAAIDAYVQEQMAAHHIPGMSVAVVKGGEAVLAKGYGLANLELGVAASPDTVYELLSIGKQFTAAAVLLLHQQGKLDIAAPVSRYLDELPAAWRSITITQLLTHTSGIKDYTDAPGWQDKIRLERSPLELLQTIMPTPLLFEPGTRWRYSNSGYYLLGLLVEKVGSQPLARYLAEHVFGPLGMTATRMNDAAAIIPHRATGYHWSGTELRNADPVSPSQKWAAGAFVSTVLDLAKWDRALRSEQLLPQALLARTWQPTKLSDGSQAPYGIANELANDHGHHVAGHQGGGLAFNATMLRYVDDDLTIIVLANLTQAPTKSIAQRVAAFYLPELIDTEIDDDDPDTSARLKSIVLDLAKGVVDDSLFTETAQRDLPMIRRVGPRILPPLGELGAFVLIERREEDDQTVLRYRATYAHGIAKWTFALTDDGKIASVQPAVD